MSEAAGRPFPSICAVVVTYGQRGQLCRHAAESALEAGVSDVIIIDNGSDAAARNEIAEWAQSRTNVAIRSLGLNTGSACGFARGIETALASGAAFVWLLDDDSDVEADALLALVQEVERRRQAGLSNFALVSLRPDKPLWPLLAGGRSVGESFPSHSSFLGFSVRDIPRRLVCGMRPLVNIPRLVPGLPYSMYGGLFLPRDLVAKIGLPDERFVIYFDDWEFTSRVCRMGGDLALVSGSRIFDREESWYTGAPGHWPETLVTADSDARTYYTIRNRVYFETTRWGDFTALYRLNKAVVLTLVVAAAIKDRRLQRLQLILAAVRDGEKERLGRRVELDDRL